MGSILMGTCSEPCHGSTQLDLWRRKVLDNSQKTQTDAVLAAHMI